MFVMMIVFDLIIVKFDDEPDSTPLITGDSSCYFYPQNTELCVSLESEMRKQVMTALPVLAKKDLSNKHQK